VRNDKNCAVGGRREAPVAGTPVRNARLPPEDAIGADLLDLVRRCQGGEPEAWRAFLPPLQEIGRRALRSFRLSTADSEDILADALTTPTPSASVNPGDSGVPLLDEAGTVVGNGGRFGHGD
jgi:hypothetical protein